MGRMLREQPKVSEEGIGPVLMIVPFASPNSSL